LTVSSSGNKLTQKGSYSMCKRSERRESIKRKMMEFYKSNPCVDCGETDPRVLDFDHINNKRDNNRSRYGHLNVLDGLQCYGI
jgi:hypothetical protein